VNALVPVAALFLCIACLGVKAASTSTPLSPETAQRALRSEPTSPPRPNVVRPGIASWQPGVYYKRGALVSVETAIYRCTMTHTSETGWEPSAARALWISES
jgi:hypothetical protein